MRSWYAHPKGVVALAFAPDGLRLASTGADNHTRVWDRVTGLESSSWSLRECQTVAFTPSGDRLLVEQRALGITILAPDDSVGRKTFRPMAGARGLAVAPDGKTFLYSGTAGRPGGRRCRIFQERIDDPSAIAKEVAELLAEVQRITLTLDGGLLAVSARDSEGFAVRLLDTPNHSHMGERRIAHLAAALATAFSPEGARLATASGRTAQLWDVGTGLRCARMRGHTSAVTGLTFHPDGRQLFTASRDGTVKVWNAADGSLLSTIEWDVGPLTALAVAPDGLTAAAGGSEGRIVLWDLEST
jgi:WD40 repeat protein